MSSPGTRPEYESRYNDASVRIKLTQLVTPISLQCSSENEVMHHVPPQHGLQTGGGPRPADRRETTACRQEGDHDLQRSRTETDTSSSCSHCGHLRTGHGTQFHPRVRSQCKSEKPEAHCFPCCATKIPFSLFSVISQFKSDTSNASQ